MTKHMRTWLPFLAIAAASCTGGPGTPAPIADDGTTWQPGRLSTGAHLDPAGTRVTTAPIALSSVLSPDGGFFLVSVSGDRIQGVQVIDRATETVVQTMRQPAAFIGLAFAPDGRTLYASGGNEDMIYVYDWSNGRLARRDSIILAAHATAGRRQSGRSYPAGLSLSRDGAHMYVAENLYDSLAVIDVAQRRVIQRLPAGRYPYATVASADGVVYTSSWATNAVLAYRSNADGTLRADGAITVARHPSALLLNPDGTRLFAASATTDHITVVNTQTRKVTTELDDGAAGGVGEGSTPNALALSDDGARLFVAEADNNAVAQFNLSAITSGISSAKGDDAIAGRIPVEWYPTSVQFRHDTIVVATGKGLGTRPNPNRAQPTHAATDTTSYILDQLQGSVVTVALPQSIDALHALSGRVARANGWNIRRDARFAYPPIKHVVYIIKENRTYDQVLGDMPAGDGDISLNYFPRANTPNHHALAERFGLYDRFFTNAEVSSEGHNWSVGAYSSDYVEKTTPSNYGGRGRSYDYEGTNRDVIPADDEDAAEPANGYLWDLAQRANLTFRNYGEFVDEEGPANNRKYVGTKKFLAEHTDTNYPGFDLNIQDQRRADVFLKAFDGMKAAAAMPQLTILRLPSDHTSGGRVGAHTPQAHLADNDYALARIVEAISNSPFWASTAIFVLEDDAQDGPDHVDAHRSLLFAISPYSRKGTQHRFVNTTDVIRTMSEILGMSSLSQFDRFGRPLRDIWMKTPDLSPYHALTPAISLDDVNSPSNPGREESKKLDLSAEDRSDDNLFNRILWKMMKPGTPYPGTTRMSASEMLTHR